MRGQGLAADGYQIVGRGKDDGKQKVGGLLPAVRDDRDRKSEKDEDERRQGPGDLALVFRRERPCVNAQLPEFAHFLLELIERHAFGFFFDLGIFAGHVELHERSFEVKLVKIVGIVEIRLVRGAVHELEQDLLFAGHGREFPFLRRDRAGRMPVGLGLPDADIVHPVAVDPVNEDDVAVERVHESPRFQQGGGVLGPCFLQDASLGIVGARDDAVVENKEYQRQDDPRRDQRGQQAAEGYPARADGDDLVVGGKAPEGQDDRGQRGNGQRIAEQHGNVVKERHCDRPHADALVDDLVGQLRQIAQEENERQHSQADGEGGDAFFQDVIAQDPHGAMANVIRVTLDAPASLRVFAASEAVAAVVRTSSTRMTARPAMAAGFFILKAPLTFVQRSFAPSSLWRGVERARSRMSSLNVKESSSATPAASSAAWL